MGHNIQKLRELIIVPEVIHKLIFHLFREIHSNHHDDILPGHVGFQVAESLWKFGINVLSNLFKMNSNRFHVILEFSSKDGFMLGHKMILEANLVAIGKILVWLEIEPWFQHEFIILSSGIGDEYLFEIGTISLEMFKVSVANVFHSIEVKSTLHLVCLWLYQILL